MSVGRGRGVGSAGRPAAPRPAAVAATRAAPSSSSSPSACSCSSPSSTWWWPSPACRPPPSPPRAPRARRPASSSRRPTRTAPRTGWSPRSGGRCATRASRPTPPAPPWSSAAPGPCLTPGADVTVTVRVDVPLPVVPAGVSEVVPLVVPVSASHTQVVGEFEVGAVRARQGSGGRRTRPRAGRTTRARCCCSPWSTASSRSSWCSSWSRPRPCTWTASGCSRSRTRRPSTRPTPSTRPPTSTPTARPEGIDAVPVTDRTVRDSVVAYLERQQAPSRFTDLAVDTAATGTPDGRSAVVVLTARSLPLLPDAVAGAFTSGVPLRVTASATSADRALTDVQASGRAGHGLAGHDRQRHRRRRARGLVAAGRLPVHDDRRGARPPGAQQPLDEARVVEVGRPGSPTTVPSWTTGSLHDQALPSRSGSSCPPGSRTVRPLSASVSGVSVSASPAGGAGGGGAARPSSRAGRRGRRATGVTEPPGAGVAVGEPAGSGAADGRRRGAPCRPRTAGAPPRRTGRPRARARRCRRTRPAAGPRRERGARPPGRAARTEAGQQGSDEVTVGARAVPPSFSTDCPAQGLLPTSHSVYRPVVVSHDGCSHPRKVCAMSASPTLPATSS